MLSGIEYAILDVVEHSESQTLTSTKVVDYAMVRRYPGSRELYLAALTLLSSSGLTQTRMGDGIVITKKGREVVAAARRELRDLA